MNLSLILFLTGILGFFLYRKNIILMLISIEIMLLAITFLILVCSLSFDDILGKPYVIMYLAITVLPLLGSIISGFFGRKVGVSGAQLITCISVIITTILAIIAFIEVGLNNIPVSIHLFRWIDSESLNVLWGFQFDSLTVSMLIPVLKVSSVNNVRHIMKNNSSINSCICILFTQNSLSDTFSKIMASVPVIYDDSLGIFLIIIVSIPVVLVLWSKIGDLLNDRDITPKLVSKKDAPEKPEQEERHHVDIGVCFVPGTPFTPSKHLIYDKNQYHCTRLKNLYMFPTITRTMQPINGVIRPCFRLDSQAVQPVNNNNPYGPVWVDKMLRNALTTNYIVTSGNRPITSNPTNTKDMLLP